MRHGRWVAALVLAVVCGTLPSAWADQPIELIDAPTAPLKLLVQRSVPGVLAEVRLHNPAGTARIVRPGDKLVRALDGLVQRAEWQGLDAGGTVSIPAGGDATLTLSGTLPDAGVYELWIDTFIPAEGTVREHTERRIQVVVTRTAPPAVTSDLLPEAKAMQIVRWPWTKEASTALIPMVNMTAAPLEFRTPSLLSVGQKVGDASIASSPGRLPELEAGDCSSPLAAGARCALRLTVNGGWGPGQYTADIGVAGVGGGYATRSVPIAVRLPILVPILVTALGVGAGTLVQMWRATGRRAMTSLIELGRLRDRVNAIVKANPTLDLNPYAAPILAALTAAQGRAQTDADAADNIKALGARVDQLANVAAVEPEFEKLPQEAQVILAAPHQRFLQQCVAVVSGRGAEGPDAVAPLVAMLHDWPGLVGAGIEAEACLQLVRRLVKLDCAGLDESQGVDALKSALAAASAAVPGDAAYAVLGDRSVALRAATKPVLAAIRLAVTERAAEFGELLASRLKGTTTTLPDLQEKIESITRPILRGNEANAVNTLDAVAKDRVFHPGTEAVNLPSLAAAPVPGVDLPTAVLIGWTPTRTTASLETERNWFEWGTNAIILLALSLSGAVLVGSNTSWGSWLDIITLWLAGFGSRVVLDSLALRPATAAAGH